MAKKHEAPMTEDQKQTIKEAEQAQKAAKTQKKPAEDEPQRITEISETKRRIDY